MPKKIIDITRNKSVFSVSLGYDETGKQIVRKKTVTYKNAKEKKALYAEFMLEAQRGLVSTVESHTLDSLHVYWAENYSKTHLELTTQIHYQYLYKRIGNTLGKKKLADIKPAHILNFHQVLRDENLSSETILKYHKFLKLLFSKAVRWEFVSSNPCDKVDTPKRQPSKVKIYNDDELKAFLAIVDNEPVKYQLMTYLGLIGGLRREEIFGLEWDRIDWEKNTVLINQAAPYMHKDTAYLKMPKNASSVRTVSLPDSVMKLFKLQKENQEREAQSLQNQWVCSNRVFTQWNGTPGHPHSFNTWMRKLTIKHGLPLISPHKLRHLSATHLINLGVDIKTVSYRLGHSRTSTTTDIYSHLVEKSEVESAQKIDELLQKLKCA